MPLELVRDGVAPVPAGDPAYTRSMADHLRGIAARMDAGVIPTPELAVLVWVGPQGQPQLDSFGRLATYVEVIGLLELGKSKVIEAVQRSG